MRDSAFLWLIVAVGIIGSLAWDVEAAEAAKPVVEQVAPGIWRIRYGQPEPLTPLTYRSGTVQLDSLAALPAVEKAPISIEQTSFVIRPRGISIELPMAKNERIYGLGLNIKFFEMSGKRAFIVPGDHPDNDANTSHAPVPFYVSSQGFGVYVDTARFASFYTGNVDATTRPPDGDDAANTAAAATGVEDLYRARELRQRTMLIDVPVAQGADVYIFAGPTMMDAVRRYNLFSGGGCVPPMWGLGMGYRSLNKFTAVESVNLAKSFREQHIPCDMWGLEPGWQTKTYSCSFLWNKEGFPDPDSFVKQMHEMGYRLNLWEHSFTHPTSPIYGAISRWSGNYRVWGGVVPDFATPQARKIFLDHHEKEVFSRGISGVKLDECDYQPFRAVGVWSFPEASVFPSGLDGEQMHSLLGTLYQQTMMEPYTSRNLRTWGLVRSSHALAAPLPYSVYSDAYDHVSYVRGVAKSGFQGLLWTPEVRSADSLEDLYRRTQTVIFTPFAQIDCWFLRMPPWLQFDRAKNNAGEVMPNHVQVTAEMKKLFDLRMSLIPYLYSAFNDYRLRGTPPNRAMVMDWPDDRNCAEIDDQFMCGPSLLVAPMFKDQTVRSVYLPAGDWYDFWTGEKFTGPERVGVYKPATVIPVFVKGGTLLPLAKPLERVADDALFEMTVRVYGKEAAELTLFEDDGVSNDYAAGKQNRIKLKWDGAQGSEQKSGGYDGAARYKIVEWKQMAN